MAKETMCCNSCSRLAVVRAAEVFAAGGVVVFPTETVYGIGVRAGDAEAAERLRRLKGRLDGKPFQYLAADVAMAERLGAVFSGRAQELAQRFWPGALTLVVPDSRATGGTLGIRIPDSRFVLDVCRELDSALVTSSANPAGAPPPLTAADADVFGTAVDLLVDGGVAAGGVPSTVARCDGDELLILREGGIAPGALLAAWDG